ncbi:amidohydrolase family protein (plasmid) [Haloferax prahovense]|uniref:amidohydrolase family protein n=1 Tax=Haloferax prahovense TaxID=381852 RepID=UPI003C74E964
MADIVIRDGYLDGHDAVVDIEIDDGKIREIDTEVNREGVVELNAQGNLVSPGLVDAHVHLDMSRSAYGNRCPKHNNTLLDMDVALEKSASYFATSSRDEIHSNIQTAGEQAIVNGVLHARTHAYVDSQVGADVVEWVLDAREQFDILPEIEVVAFPQQGVVRDDGSAAAMRSALDAGADLAGGLDPDTLNGDRENTIQRWFDIATEYDVDLDVHIHESGPSGLQTLERLAAKTVDEGYEGRVTASHSYALADAATARAGDDADRLPELMDCFSEAAMEFITCYQSTPVGMPIRRFHEAGLVMAHGTDQIHDLWGSHGNFDALEAMLVESLKLQSYSTNRGLQRLWELITTKGADVLGIDGYDIEIGTPANLVVHSASSPQWAIVENETPAYVVKNGKLVAEDGALTE